MFCTTFHPTEAQLYFWSADNGYANAAEGIVALQKAVSRLADPTLPLRVCCVWLDSVGSHCVGLPLGS